MAFPHVKKIFALPMALILILALGFFGVRGFAVNSVALEQYARCGMTEHIHDEQCYSDNHLICFETEHSHSENCYLVLLSDNNINDLINNVDEQDDNSLESLIQTTSASSASETSQQLVLNEDIYTESTSGDLIGAVLPAPKPTPVRSVSYALSNNSSSNSSSRSSSGSSSADEQSAAYAVAPLSLDDPQSTYSYTANYYVFLDNSWRSVGNLWFSVQRVDKKYDAWENLSEVVNLYNDSLSLELDSNDMHFVFAESPNPDGWEEATKEGTYLYLGKNYGKSNDADDTKYVRLVDENGFELAFYTVKLNYLNGTSKTLYVLEDDSITLPDVGDNCWISDGVTYQGGDDVDIKYIKTFTETEIDTDTRLKIIYNVNFIEPSGVTVDTVPTLFGTADTSVTDRVEDNSNTLIRRVSSTEIRGDIDSSNTGNTRVIRFLGWKVQGTDDILNPNSTLTWDELVSYVNGGKSITLNGVWESNPLHTASFFVRYDSVAVDTDGNVTGQDENLYTDELFSLYVGGIDPSVGVNRLNELYRITDTTSDNSYGADQKIRALEGQKADKLWLYSFPRDEEVFEKLQGYTRYLSVGGVPVESSQLNDNYYTIRWYVFKAQDDAWHVDGRLVKKESLFDITKTFAGNPQAISNAKDGFYITARNLDGDELYHLYITRPDTPPGDGEVKLPTKVEDDKYIWTITGAEYGDRWIATEYPVAVSNAISHSEYRLIDVYGEQSTNGTSNVVEFFSDTVATDMYNWQAMSINFTNIYHNRDSIIIKKEDALTGNPIGGAIFKLIQNGETLRFTYDSSSDTYSYDPAGELTELSGSESGYYEVNINGFSYENGDIEIQETKAPEGYTPIGNILIGYQKNTLMMAMPPAQTPTDEQPIDGAQTPTDEQPVDGTQTPTDEQPIDGTQTPTDEQPVDGTQTPTDEQPVDGTQTPTDEQPVDGTQTPTDGQTVDETETTIDGQQPESEYLSAAENESDSAEEPPVAEEESEPAEEPPADEEEEEEDQEEEEIILYQKPSDDGLDGQPPDDQTPLEEQNIPSNEQMPDGEDGEIPPDQPANEETELSEGQLTAESENKGPLMMAVSPAATTVDTSRIVILNPSDMTSYSEGLLIIKNTTESTSVTVEKEWLCPQEEWTEVTMQLMANDAPVTSLISGVPLTKVLNSGNSYTATWTELPLYANGQEIVWSVREVKIGNENCLADYSFANWLVDYDNADYTFDDEGNVTNISFTVKNDTYRTLLRVTKTNFGGTLRLQGATFTLERLVDGVPDESFTVRTMTTPENGMVTFDNLKFGDYRLTETVAPSGYDILEEPVYLTIKNDGSVEVQENEYAKVGSTAHSILVFNQTQMPLPSAGGEGTYGYRAAGLMLIMAAIGSTLFRKRRKEELISD